MESLIFHTSSKTCRWSHGHHPKEGLTLNNPTVSDTAFYYVFGILKSRRDLYNDNNNNNSNPIVGLHDVETTKMLRLLYPQSWHQANYVTIISFSLTVTGNRIVKISANICKFNTF
jgi:hypothetical protein